jgi:hypothetical protein
MEHSYIEDHNIAERYLSGKLSPEERMRFEEHFVDCTQCLDRLEPIDDHRDGLKPTAAEEAFRRAPVSRWGYLLTLEGLAAGGRYVSVANTPSARRLNK